MFGLESKDSSPHFSEIDMSYSMETCFKIWDDAIGDRYEICPDADGSGLLEIRYVIPDGTITSRISFPPEIAPFLSEALLKVKIEEQKDASSQS